MPDVQPETAEIAIRLRHIGQLFNSLDPSPFREKDLDAAAEEFIVSWARELPHTAPLRIVVRLSPEEAARPETAQIAEALPAYFEYRARAIDQELRELHRIGWRAGVIGLFVLASCLTASQLLAPLAPNATTARVIEESFIIVGWVANWRPIEIYLYDWWPIRRRANLYRRIAAAPVRVVPDDAPASGRAI